MIFFKSVHIWQSYEQERGCLMHFARLANTQLKDEESARDNHVLACNIAEYSPILILFTRRLSNKPFVIWSLKAAPHLKYAAWCGCDVDVVCLVTKVGTCGPP